MTLVPPNGSDPASKTWHVDRRIPIVLIASGALAVLAQSAGIGAYAVSVQSQISALQQLVTVLKEEADRRAPFIERFIKAESAVVYLQQDTNRRLTGIEAALERLVARPSPQP